MLNPFKNILISSLAVILLGGWIVLQSSAGQLVSKPSNVTIVENLTGTQQNAS